MGHNSESAVKSIHTCKDIVSPGSSIKVTSV